jgi:periplasmic protein TonB
LSAGVQVLERPREGAELRVAFAAAVSFVLHLGLFLFLTSHSAPPAVRKLNDINLEVNEVERTKPPPPPVEKTARRIEPVVARIPRPPQPHELPPPPNQPPPKAAPPQAPPPIHIGVNLESTVQGGAFAAPVGNSLYGVAPVQAPAPAAVKPYWAAKYMAPTRVSELPVLLDEVKAPYPPGARKEGIEGQVIFTMTIDDQGKVAEVKFISGPGHGLNEAALKAATQFRFKPATLHGLAVATSIRYVYSFEID